MSEGRQRPLPESAPAPPGALRLGLRWSASALAFGVLCAALFAITVPLVLPCAIWLANHLAWSAPGQAATATAVLGLSQALVCAAVLAPLSRLIPVARPVAVAAGLLAAALPALVLLASQGFEALLPAAVLGVRVANLLVCGAASGLATRASRAR